MKISLQKETFLKVLSQVSSVVDRKQIKPILSHVLLQAKDTLSVHGTDLDNELLFNIPEADIHMPGDITVSAKKLLDVVRAMPEGAIVHLGFDQEKLLISSEKVRYSLNTLPKEEFPTFSSFEPEASFELPVSLVVKLFHQTSFAIGQQDSRYYLNGLFFSMNRGVLKAVASDGHRLIELVLPCPEHLRFEGIFPRKAVIDIQRLLSDESGDIFFSLYKNAFSFSSNRFCFKSKLMEGHYPEYHRVFPEVDATKSFWMDKALLKHSLMRVSALFSDRNRGVNFSFDKQKLKLWLVTQEQDEVEEELDITYDGPPIQIGLNVQYLMDFLNNSQGEVLRGQLASSKQGVKFETLNAEDGVYVVMPMLL